jgi:hypothetical protein
MHLPGLGPGGLRTQFDVTSERRLIRPIFKKPNRITAPPPDELAKVGAPMPHFTELVVTF